jgi:hypothetical protein
MAGNLFICKEKIAGFPQPGSALKPRNPWKVYSEYNYPFARGVS